MKLKLQLKSVYGVERIYPICDISKRLANFKGSKTFTHSDIMQLSNIGYDFDWVANVPNFEEVN